MAKVKKNKRFTLMGNNQKPVVPQKPAPIQLTLANAPLWQAKFTEEIRNELRILNNSLEKILANAGTQ